MVLSQCGALPLCSATLQLYSFLSIVGVHPVLMLAVFVVWICILGCQLHFVWCLFPYIHILDRLVFHLFLVFVGIASLQ